MIPAFEQAKTIHALDCAATVIGFKLKLRAKDWWFNACYNRKSVAPMAARCTVAAAEYSQHSSSATASWSAQRSETSLSYLATHPGVYARKQKHKKCDVTILRN
jgi:hypothetical protein